MFGLFSRRPKVAVSRQPAAAAATEADAHRSLDDPEDWLFEVFGFGPDLVAGVNVGR